MFMSFHLFYEDYHSSKNSFFFFLTRLFQQQVSFITGQVTDLTIFHQSSNMRNYTYMALVFYLSNNYDFQGSNNPYLQETLQPPVHSFFGLMQPLTGFNHFHPFHIQPINAYQHILTPVGVAIILTRNNNASVARNPKTRFLSAVLLLKELVQIINNF
jgi:hypothetical protein